MMMFTFFIFGHKYPFWANLIQKFKIVSLSWKLVLRLIWIWRIQWWCSSFLFLTKSILFLEICSINQISWSRYLEPRWIHRIRWWFSYFFINPFWVNLLQKLKRVSCFRSSRSQIFFEIGVHKTFAIFTRKHLCWSLLIKF